MTTYTPQTPVGIDLIANPQQAAESSAAFFGTFALGNSLYTITSNNDTGTIACYKSVDAGVTWIRQDTANEPVSLAATGSAFLPPGDISIFVATNLDGLGIVVNNRFICGPGFDQWQVGGAHGGAPTPDVIYTLFQRTNGDSVVIYNRNSHPGDSGFYFAVADLHNAWLVTDVDLGTNITGLPGYDPALVTIILPCAVIGADDSIYVFFTINSGLPAWEGRIFYQRIAPDNSVGAGSPGDFFDFPGQGVALPDLNGFGKPCIAQGNKIFLPVSRNNPFFFPNARPYATYYIGFIGGGGTVSWFESTTGLGCDPTLAMSPLGSCSQIGAAFFDGVDVWINYLWFGTTNNTNSAWRLCKSSGPLNINPNSFAWTAQTVVDLPVAGNPLGITILAFPAIQIWVNGPFTFVVLQSDGLIGGVTETVFYWGDFRVVPDDFSLVHNLDSQTLPAKVLPNPAGNC